MSLYGMVVGNSPEAPGVMALLGLSPQTVPRLRDAYLDTTNKRFVIYTRTGGGNRDFYESEAVCRQNYPSDFMSGELPPSGPWNDDLRKHPLYISDEDDPYDSTYASFYFRFPDDHRAMLEEVCAQAPPTVTPAEKMKAAVEALRK